MLAYAAETYVGDASLPVYGTIEDIPLDEWNGEDEDNSVLGELPKYRLPYLDTHAPVGVLPPKGRVVPYFGPLKEGSRGNAVYAMKRALVTANHTWPKSNTFTKLFGGGTLKELQTFQHHHGLAADGIYGERTHRHLAPYYDAHGVWILAHIHRVDPKETIINKIVYANMLGYQLRYIMHYTMGPLRGTDFAPPPNVPNNTDCSGFATWGYKSGGAPDPNGFNYRVIGYTGTQIRHGWRIDAGRPDLFKQGDLVFYGNNSHVATVVTTGNTPNVVSFGSEVGPLYLRWNYRSDIYAVHRYL